MLTYLKLSAPCYITELFTECVQVLCSSCWEKGEVLAGAQRTAGAFGTQEGVGVSSGLSLHKSQLKFWYCLGDAFSFLPPTFKQGWNRHYISEDSSDSTISFQFQKSLGAFSLPPSTPSKEQSPSPPVVFKIDFMIKQLILLNQNLSEVDSAVNITWAERRTLFQISSSYLLVLHNQRTYFFV